MEKGDQTFISTAIGLEILAFKKGIKRKKGDTRDHTKTCVLALLRRSRSIKSFKIGDRQEEHFNWSGVYNVPKCLFHFGYQLYFLPGISRYFKCRGLFPSGFYKSGLFHSGVPVLGFLAIIRPCHSKNRPSLIWNAG